MATVLFVAAHPDDETLGMSVAIAEHVAAGHDVHVLLLTRGESSSVRDTLNGVGVSPWWGLPHDPVAEGYGSFDGMSEEEFGAFRYKETATALRCLGPVTLHEGGLFDGLVTPAAIEGVIVDLADEICPGAPLWIKTHTHLVDDHDDHLAAGVAARALAAWDPTRFGNLRHYILPRYWTDHRLGQVVEKWDLPTDSAIAQRVVNACRSYGAWAPDRGSYAIGYHSVYTDMFAPLLASPKSLYHP